MRRKTIRQIQVVKECGIFGKCLCGGDVLFYSDSGVKCMECGKLYGTWLKKKKKSHLPSKAILQSKDEKIEPYNSE